MSLTSDSHLQTVGTACHHQQLFDKEIAEALINGDVGTHAADISIEGSSSKERLRSLSSDLTSSSLNDHNVRVFVGPQHFSIMKLIGEVRSSFFCILHPLLLVPSAHKDFHALCFTFYRVLLVRFFWFATSSTISNML